MQVWLSGHVPPTQGNWYSGCPYTPHLHGTRNIESCCAPTGLERYTEITISFQDTILGQVFGHVNVDTFSYLDYKSLSKKRKAKSATKGDYSIAKFTHNDLYSVYEALPTTKKLRLEDYVIAHTSPSVIPTYLPSVRVWHYNVTDEDDTYLPGPHALVDSPRSSLWWKTRAAVAPYFGRLDIERLVDTDLDIFRRKRKGRKHRRKKKKPVQRLPRYASADSPARRNRYLTPLGYTQYYLPIDRYQEPNWTLEYITYPEKRMQHFLPKHMQLNASMAGIDAPYQLDDLTIPSWLTLAKGLTRSKRKWKQYVRRMYVDSGAEKQ